MCSFIDETVPGNIEDVLKIILKIYELYSEFFHGNYVFVMTGVLRAINLIIRPHRLKDQCWRPADLAVRQNLDTRG